MSGLQACLSALFTVGLGAMLIGLVSVDRSIATVLPPVVAKDVSLFDTRLVPITVSVFWQKAPRTVTVDRLLRDHTLWRQMHFDDWDKVPTPVRERALARMLEHYAEPLAGPHVWAAMSVYDWDYVPHPIRVIAYQRMVEHWTGYYDVGAGYADNPEVVARTVSAIVMAESWFEHRAINVNEWDNRDLGLAGCSNHCRRVLEELALKGPLDFLFDEHEYFDPWNGTRVAAVWFGRELVRAGDLDVAIAAYHRGLEAARRGDGARYAANVKRLRHRYMEGHGAPPAWAFITREAASRGRTAG
jgi:hypothetical protein